MLINRLFELKKKGLLGGSLVVGLCVYGLFIRVLTCGLCPYAPPPPKAYLLMADCVKRAGDYITAIDYFTRAIDRDPNNAGT